MGAVAGEDMRGAGVIVAGAVARGIGVGTGVMRGAAGAGAGTEVVGAGVLSGGVRGELTTAGGVRGSVLVGVVIGAEGIGAARPGGGAVETEGGWLAATGGLATAAGGAEFRLRVRALPVEGADWVWAIRRAARTRTCDMARPSRFSP